MTEVFSGLNKGLTIFDQFNNSIDIIITNGKPLSNNHPTGSRAFDTQKDIFYFKQGSIWITNNYDLLHNRIENIDSITNTNAQLISTSNDLISNLSSRVIVLEIKFNESNNLINQHDQKINSFIETIYFHDSKIITLINSIEQHSIEFDRLNRSIELLNNSMGIVESVLNISRNPNNNITTLTLLLNQHSVDIINTNNRLDNTIITLNNRFEIIETKLNEIDIVLLNNTSNAHTTDITNIKNNLNILNESSQRHETNITTNNSKINEYLLNIDKISNRVSLLENIGTTSVVNSLIEIANSHTEKITNFDCRLTALENKVNNLTACGYVDLVQLNNSVTTILNRIQIIENNNNTNPNQNNIYTFVLSAIGQFVIVEQLDKLLVKMCIWKILAQNQNQTEYMEITFISDFNKNSSNYFISDPSIIGEKINGYEVIVDSNETKIILQAKKTSIEDVILYITKQIIN